ncbi:flagellar filament capping protein FliD [Halodesulfovibrio marinisediminis]|uniref:Flagellar hook-associated protein 2 n=1 Tax=Halodesulfovibrio marinisediminis DSM 17456 TaxID=1121457 RepID=A0A1N6DSB6_9BACT|nr:flagellar filament capping protein FliD [Halodesulfovibrio marinisediminis]SIN73630.1 Flagellar hook-associated protein 2 N-terminus [Halodesulfovibrio marinisediminis DSM 17456]
MSDYWSSKTVFAGWATKTDFNKIIDATVKTEKYRYNQLSKQEAETTFKKDQIEGLNRTVLTYKKQLESMDTIDEFLVRKVTSSKTDVVTATVKSGAQEGSHTLEVKQLASVATVSSHDIGEVAYTAAAKDMTFTYDGETYTVNVKSGMTTKELATAIATASGNKVKTSVIDLGHESKYKLQIRGMELGAGHNIGLSAELKAVLQGQKDPAVPLPPETKDIVPTPSKNAKLVVDGVDLQRGSNSVSDVTEGVTYNLNAEEPGTTVTIKVETDFDAIVANVEKFVKLTNELRTGFDLVKNYKNEDLDKKGVNYSLKGNSQIKSVEDKLKNVLATQGDGFIEGSGAGNDLYVTLSALGIKTIARKGDKNYGKLEFDKNAAVIKGGTKTFMDLLKADPEAVAKVFAAEGEGSSSNSSVLEYNSSMYSFGFTKPGTYAIEYDGGTLPTTGESHDITMKINGVERKVGYNVSTRIATVNEGDAKGLAFKVVDTSAGTHSATIAIKEGKVKETIRALDEITEVEKGTFVVMIKGYKKQIDDPASGLKKKMADELARVTALEKRLIAQYAATEKTLANYQNIQKMLEFQLKSQLAKD